MPLVKPIDTIAAVFDAVTTRFASSKRSAFLRKVGKKYVGTSYKEFREQVEALALALRALGLSRGDRIGISSENRLEWVIADFACAASGLVDVPVFPILTAEQISYIFNDAGARTIICSNEFQLGKLAKVLDNLPAVRHIIVMEKEALGAGIDVKGRELYSLDALIAEGRKIAAASPEQFDRLMADVTPDDLLTLIYTSGTTGAPKGVMLTHANFAANVTGAAAMIPVSEEDVILSYLPLCHAYERTAGYYTCFGCGATIAFAESIDTVAQNLPEVRPTIMTSVPRLFERIKNRVEKSMEKESERSRKVFAWAIDVGRKRFRREAAGKGVGIALRTKNALAERLVFSKIRERTGGRIRFFVSGGAPLPYEVGEFFFAIGMTVIEGYGLTEASPILSANPSDRQKLGTVGVPLPNVELRLAPDGEILARGPNVMKGYYKCPDETEEVIDSEGWLHTGDIGEFDGDGYLRITDRKKHIFVSSGGKNIAPAPIEEHLSQSRFIDQMMLIGDNRPFLTALIVPDFEALKEALGEAGAAAGDLRDEAARRALVESESAHLTLEGDIRRLQRDLSAFERVRRFELLPDAFTVENDMLTPTLKVKRKVVEKRYQDLIEGMYAGTEEM